MKCGEYRRSPNKGKKMVYKACDGDRQALVHFGAKGYKHNYSPEAKRSFRARHGCDQAKDKFTAKYHACRKLWPKGQKADGKAKK